MRQQEQTSQSGTMSCRLTHLHPIGTMSWRSSISLSLSWAAGYRPCRERDVARAGLHFGSASCLP